MGVKTSLAGIAFTTAGKNAALAAGTNVNDLMAEAQMKCQEATNLLNQITTTLTGVSGESSNLSTIATQTTALS